MTKPMKFTEVKERFYIKSDWYARRNNIKYRVASYRGDRFYVTANCCKTQVTFNSLWKEVSFATLDEAFTYCENFSFEENIND
jgi:hypothetical protein